MATLANVSSLQQSAQQRSRWVRDRRNLRCSLKLNASASHPEQNANARAYTRAAVGHVLFLAFIRAVYYANDPLVVYGSQWRGVPTVIIIILRNSQ